MGAQTLKWEFSSGASSPRIKGQVARFRGDEKAGAEMIGTVGAGDLRGGGGRNAVNNNKGGLRPVGD